VLIIVPTRLEMRRLFPECGQPAVHPTIVSLRAENAFGEAVDVACCGMGLAASGAGVAALLATRQDSACLAGLAGTLDPDAAPIGSVIVAGSVEVEGIGLPGDPSSRGGKVEGELDAELRDDPARLGPPAPWLPAGIARLARVGGLLSVAIPSVDRGEAACRRAAHPGCIAEEMEAHAALHAAGFLGRRLVVVRGISNIAGERDKAGWHVDAALAAVRDVLDTWLAARED
jgi:futalosine hydrolase